MVVVGLNGSKMTDYAYFKWFLFSLDSAMLGLPFFMVGYYMKDAVLSYSQKNLRFVTAIILTAIMFLCPFNGQVDMFEGDYGNNYIIFILFGIAGSLLLLNWSSYLTVHSHVVTKIVRGAPFLICTHLFFLNYLYLAYRLLMGQQLTAPVPFLWWEKLLFTIISLVISYVCISMIVKKAPILLGR